MKNVLRTLFKGKTHNSYLEFSTLSVFYNKVILRGRIFDDCHARSSKLTFHVLLNFDLTEVIF